MLSPAGAVPTISVCVVTYERPAFLDRCLSSIARSGQPVDQVVVVDASAADRTKQVTALADELSLPVTYVWAHQLAGWMTRSRNEALRWVQGDVVAFLDDDVVVDVDWAGALRDVFRDATVAAVAGRTRNNIEGEEAYDQPVGRYLPTGRLTEGFAVVADEPFDVDHGIGANMSFRRSVLGELGGFRDDYPGTALREDTDIFLRVRTLGRRVVFAPRVLVDHLPAPHVVGARFDTRYKLYGRRNHLVLLARHRGLGSPDVRRWVADELRGVGGAEGVQGKLLRLGVTVAGLGWGLGAALRQASWRPTPPRRTGAAADEVRARLRG